MIVLINPNSTVSMTQAMRDAAQQTKPDAHIVGWTSHAGPPAIQGPEDGDASVPPLLRLIKKANDAGAKAIIIGCFDDTGLDEARNISNCPVIGIGQAAYHLATIIGGRFSVVTTLDVSVPVLHENIASYGLAGHVGRVRASGVPVLDLETDRACATTTVIAEINRALKEDDVNCVVLGCAGMTHITEAFGRGKDAILVDGVRAATIFASTIS